MDQKGSVVRRNTEDRDNERCIISNRYQWELVDDTVLAGLYGEYMNITASAAVKAARTSSVWDNAMSVILWRSYE